MSKIVCDICGTTYPDTAQECPICGCAKDSAAALLGEELFEEAPVQETVKKTGAFTPAARKSAPVVEDDFDDDEDFDDEEDYDDDDDDDDDDADDEDEGKKSNAGLVVLLVIVILALLAVSAFILVKYVLPNVMGPEETAPSTVQTTAPAEESTELVIPCENLAMTSSENVVLEYEGANWLINVQAVPENTTDVLTYTSSDEAVAVVNEQGKVTAVGEGTAVIIITCGEHELKCTVNVTYIPETTIPETTVPETTVPEESVPETTVPEETTPETEAPAEVTGVITASTLNIRATPDSNGRVVGIYSKGAKVTILEQKTVGNTVWGRTDKGWISMKYVKTDN